MDNWRHFYAKRFKTDTAKGAIAEAFHRKQGVAHKRPVPPGIFKGVFNTTPAGFATTDIQRLPVFFTQVPRFAFDPLECS